MLLAVWLLAFALTLIVSHQTDQEVGLCQFRALTDIPCATCGGTRAGLSLLRGDLAGALRFNPLVTLALLTGGLVCALRVSLRQQMVIEAGRRGWICLTAILIVAVCINWVYVIAFHST